jgi:hypothetical protein
VRHTAGFASLYPLYDFLSNQLIWTAYQQCFPTMSQCLPAMPDFPIDIPAPVPPDRPSDDECCRSGCAPCVFDRYAEELAHYRAALRAWEEKQAGRNKVSESAS